MFIPPTSAAGFTEASAEGAVIKSPEKTKEQIELENIQEFFFETPLTSTPEVKYINTAPPTYGPGGESSNTSKRMPLFKQMRIKITNYYKIKAHNRDLKQKEIEEKELLELEDEESTLLQDIQKENLHTSSDVNEDKDIKEKNFSFFKRKNYAVKKQTEKQKEEHEVEVSDKTKSDESIELQGGVTQLEAEKDVQLDCEIINYLPERGEMEALGHPVLYFPPQNTTLKADRITYNVVTNVIKAFDNVELIRDGNTMYGDYLQINMNEENSFMTNMKADQAKLIINAKVVNASDDLAILEQGNITSEDHYIMKFLTQFMSARVDLMVIPEAVQSHISDFSDDKSNIKIVAKEIHVNAKKTNDVVTAKQGTVYYAGKKLFNFPSFTAHTNKEHNYFEANYPEFGSKARLGMFFGPGFVFDTPFGGTLKLMPLLNYKDGFGFGGGLKYRSATNLTQMAYGSAENVFVLRGKQFLDDKLFLQYGVNSYMNDWWMGQRMAKYLAEFVYHDVKEIPGFMGPNRGLRFSHRIGAGYMQDTDVNRFDEQHMKSSEMGTTRFKYMAEIYQNLYSYNNPQKHFMGSLGLMLQGSAALYGTGDTQMVGRIGPWIHTQYKYWMQDIGYFMSTYDDHTPMPRYDTYRYGRSNVLIREAIRLNKYLTVAWAGQINLTDDAPNGKMFQENAFIFSVGPDDFKVNVGYDFMRQQTYFSLAMALDMKGSSIEYDKMKVKHPDKIGKSDKTYVKEVTFEDSNAVRKPPKRVHAEVINIEDPNKEQL